MTEEPGAYWVEGLDLDALDRTPAQQARHALAQPFLRDAIHHGVNMWPRLDPAERRALARVIEDLDARTSTEELPVATTLEWMRQLVPLLRALADLSL